MKNTRLGNIEIRKYDTNPSHYAYEIIKWYPNDLFGRDDEFPESETSSDFRTYPDNPHHRIHKDYFKYPEFCYTLALITNDKEPNIECIGARPWELNKEDRKNFDTIINKYFKIK